MDGRSFAAGIEPEPLERAQALREAFAACHGVLDVDLVEAARNDRQCRADGAHGLTEEEEDDQSHDSPIA